VAVAGGGTTMTKTGKVYLNNFWGWPIVVSDLLPGNSSTDYSGLPIAYFGDLRKAVAMGSREDVQVDILQERYAEYGLIATLGTERFDIVVHDCDSTSDAGPIVALFGGSS
jgi:HK97 family phage major capsid protein